MPVIHWECHEDTMVKAWSVRPDLWPPGTRAVTRSWVALAVMYYGAVDHRVDRQVVQYSQPGVAEALILAGLVDVLADTMAGIRWDPVLEVTCP